MGYQRPSFTAVQRSELTGLGILSQQIDALEDVALRIGSVALRNEDQAPARGDVMTEFTKVANALEAEHRALHDLEAARDDEPAHVARVRVRGRIEVTSYTMGAGVEDESILHKVLYGVSAAQAVVSRAMADVPKGPTRRKTASPFPVSLVEKALLHGWVTAHRDQSMPACNCPASAGLKQPFRRVVQLCYEAMGHKNDDPDRAIKGFMKWRKEERNVRQI